jgi:hypothetical protein
VSAAPGGGFGVEIPFKADGYLSDLRSRPVMKRTKYGKVAEAAHRITAVSSAVVHIPNQAVRYVRSYVRSSRIVDIRPIADTLMAMTPTAKTAETPSFRLSGIWRRKMVTSGGMGMAISDTRLIDDMASTAVIINGSPFKHFPGTLGSHMMLRGQQTNMKSSKSAE